MSKKLNRNYKRITNSYSLFYSKKKEDGKMTENNSKFDFSDFYEEGFEKTENLEQAIYVFQDGTLWSGYSEGGDGFSRDVDHGSIEAF